MSVVFEQQRIEEDLSRIQALLEKLPPSRVLERVGFEARRDELKQALDALERGSAVPETPLAPLVPKGTATAGDRRRFIEDELRDLEALLARLPKNRVLERVSLEARRDGLREELAAFSTTVKVSAGRASVTISISPFSLEAVQHAPFIWLVVKTALALAAVVALLVVHTSGYLPAVLVTLAASAEWVVPRLRIRMGDLGFEAPRARRSPTRLPELLAAPRTSRGQRRRARTGR